MKPDYANAIWRPAAEDNYGDRPSDTEIDCIVLHATVGSLTATLGWFGNPDSGVSAHYVVDKDGRVFQMVEEQHLAHHAGASRYQGRTDFNRFSVGIEMVNKNDGIDPYPADQFEAVVGLVAYLVEKYDIKREWVVNHVDISTVGKTDPRGFPTHELIMRVFDSAASLPENVVREAAWNAAGIPFNPQAAFPRYAREHDLGNPLTDEFDFSYRGVNYRGQGFSKAVVFCVVGDWQNLMEMSW
jgi:N-acetyl-anhydromuramyl-L-alanine amidase AmpD